MVEVAYPSTKSLNSAADIDTPQAPHSARHQCGATLLLSILGASRVLDIERKTTSLTSAACDSVYADYIAW
jgi:hypothetical protein